MAAAESRRFDADSITPLRWDQSDGPRYLSFFVAHSNTCQSIPGTCRLPWLSANCHWTALHSHCSVVHYRRLASFGAPRRAVSTAAFWPLAAGVGVGADSDSGQIADNYKLYQSIINSESARNIDKTIRTQEQIDKLLGLQAPFRVAPTTPDADQPWQQEQPDDLRSKLLDRLVPSRQ
jgi:hypothetical protein